MQLRYQHRGPNMISLKRLSGLAPGLKSHLKLQLPVLGEIFVLHKRNASSQEHLLKYGAGGRNSFNGNVVTVFGGTGFLGRYVINRLAKVGTQIVIPYRGSEDDVRYIRLMGDLGQIVFMPFSINDYDSIVKTVTHSNSVINLIGRNFSNRNFHMKDSLVGAIESIARASTENGVKRLIHMSHLCAQSDSASEYMQLKAESEVVAKDAFRDVTVMRSAQVYGDEDRYLNKYAYFRKLPGVPLVRGGWDTTKQPVYVGDVAQAIVAAALDDAYTGKTFELYGPEEYFLHDIVDYTMRLIRKRWRSIPVPLQMYKFAGKMAELTPFDARLTEDMVVREFLNEIASEDAYTFADFGIDPVNLNDAALPVLRRHRDFYTFDEMKTDDDVIKPVAAYS